ncbi:MAG: hypothetical protein KJ077_10365 [Anaerolineae bacterium]|nr:hypothetical protein [Anaerolineae bacterium]
MSDWRLKVESRWHELVKRETWLWAAAGFLVLLFKTALFIEIAGYEPTSTPMLFLLIMAGIWGGPTAMLLIIVETIVYLVWFSKANLGRVLEDTMFLILSAILVEYLVIQASVSAVLQYVLGRLGSLRDDFDSLLRDWMHQRHDEHMVALGNIRNSLANLILVLQNRLAFRRDDEQITTDRQE